MARAGNLVAAALAVCMIAAVTATRHAHSADGSPITPAGDWRTVWIVGVVGSFALYGLGVVLARRGMVRLRLAVATAVLVQVVPLAAPLLLSRDAYLYWAEARVVTVHHANPYVVTPTHYPSDPSTMQASAQWRTQTEPYGPAWVALGTMPALAAGSSAKTAQLLYRILAVAGILAAAAIVAVRTGSPRAVALIGWSPLIGLHFGGGGHSDAWMGFALISAVAWRGTTRGGAAWALGSAFKAVPAILLPLELARSRLQFPRRFWLGLIGAGIAIAVVATGLFGVHWATASAIGAHGTSPLGGVHFLSEAGVRHRYAVLIGGLAFAGIYAVLLREAWQHGRARLSLAASALCMCSSLLRPWYALWPLALAAVEDDGTAELAAYALSAYVLFADAIPL